MSDIDLPGARLDHRVIVDWVAEGSSVLEPGCGGGELLNLLSRYKKASVSGIEIDEKAIFTCVSHGLSVSHQDIDEGLSEYADKAFDYVVLNRCLQEVRKPGTALSEAVRVGKRAIIGFANFAHISARIQLGFQGIAPVTPALPFQWYDTPNLHFLSIRDFITYCGKNELSIKRSAFLGKKGRINVFPNLFADLGLFEVSAAG
jgi:methionine biosynthesis protein MetW